MGWEFQTWDDVMRILPELQNNHLKPGIWPSMYTFVQFLYQNGISLYREDVVQTNLAPTLPWTSLGG